jgi:hypothetical protein
MPLTPQALDKLARLGYAAEPELRLWRGLWESEGEAFFWSFLGSHERAADEYRLWFPRLQSFAADCRRAAPAPDEDALSTAEREQRRVLLAKMREFTASEDRRAVLDRRPHQAAILSTTQVGLAAAEEVFQRTGAVVLTEEEKDRWFAEVYPGVGDGSWWYVFAWWTVQEGLDGWDEGDIRQSHPLPDGSAYWVVTSGVAWGSLAGGANHELWAFDGTAARLVEVLGVDSY